MRAALKVIYLHRVLCTCFIWLGVSSLEFNVPFQHKYGYIRDKRTGVESYPYSVKKGRVSFSSHPKGQEIKRLGVMIPAEVRVFQP